MPTVELGLDPDPLTVKLSTGSVFSSAMTLASGNWSVGDLLSLRFSDGTEWFATLTGPTAQWTVAASAVTTLITAAPNRVGLWYVTGGSPELLAYGSVVVTP